MVYVFIIASFLLSVFLSWAIIPRILIVTYKKKLFDIPNERTVHFEAIPRLGGISFLPALLISIFSIIAARYLLNYKVAPQFVDSIVPEFCLLACGLTLMFLIGVRDDLIGLRYRAKFLIQFIAACLFPLAGLWINNLYGLFGIHELTPWLGIPFTIVLTIFIVNAINLIDGIDGLASGLSMVALAFFGILYLRFNLWIYAMLAFSMMGILIPFFYYNVFGKVERRQKIFMGDTGSLTLGYILAFLSIRYASYNPEIMPYSEGAIVVAFATLIVPMFDVIRVMFVRVRNRTGVFTADKNHIHHKFLSMGLTPRKAMIGIITMACTFGFANILLISMIDNNILFFGDILLWIGLHLWFNWVRDRKEKMKEEMI